MPSESAHGGGLSAGRGDHSERHYVLIIHGTFSAPRPGTPTWYQPDPPATFCRELQDCLSAETSDFADAVWRDYDLTQFSWSGENEHFARLSAAFSFAQLCERLVKVQPHARIHVIAHSHGGNVLLQAIERLLEPIPDNYLEWRFGEALRWRLREWPRLSRWLRLRHTTAPLTASSTVSHLGRLVFLGTPFLRKEWTVSRYAFVRLGDRVLRNVFGAYFGSALFMYPAVLAVAGLLAVLPGIAFIGFNPLAWSVLMQVLAGLAVFGMGTLALGDEARFNTNLYFAEHGEQRRPLRPLDSLVVSAEHLDEALLALSAEPVIQAEVAPRIDEWLYPDLLKQLGTAWVSVGSRFGLAPPPMPSPVGHPFERYRSISGRYHGSLIERYSQVGRFVGGIGRLIVRFIAGILGVPARSFLRNVITRMVSDTITATIHGVPVEDVRGARIEVSSRIGIDKVFAEQHSDVSKVILDARRATPSVVDASRYDFLTDDERLRARQSEEVAAQARWSHLAKRLPALYARYAELGALEPSLSARQRMTKEEFEDRIARGWFVAMERFRELSGSVELFHSMYYSHPAIVKQIARFIASGGGPER